MFDAQSSVEALQRILVDLVAYGDFAHAAIIVHSCLIANWRNVSFWNLEYRVLLLLLILSIRQAKSLMS